MEALGINIFGGGFSVGVRRAGFDIVGQWEECSAGERTFDLNTKYLGGIHRPIGYANWPLLDVKHPHLVYANPPCAPWSSANTRMGMTADVRRADPRLAMTARTMETALSLEPEAFVLESVARAYSMGRTYYDGWAQRWIDLGYGVTYYLTDALLMGVPSTRQRFHFIASRHKLGIQEPAMGTFVPRTVSQAIGDLVDDFGHLPHHMPQRMGKGAHALMGITKQGRLLNGTDDDRAEMQAAVAACEWKPSFLNRKLVWDAPGFTVVNLSQHVHPLRPRFLTWREGLRLCGYPDDFLVAQSEGATQAMMPLVGEHVARIAAAAIRRAKPAECTLEIVDHRDLAKPYRPGAVRDILEEEL